MQWVDRRTLSVLFTTMLVAAVLWISWAARRPLLAFLFAIFFAYLLEPVVSRLERLVGGSRLRAIALTYAAIIGTLVVAAMVAAPTVAAQASALSRAIPTYAHQVSSGTIAQTVGAQHGWSGQTTGALQRWLVAHQDSITSAAQDVATRTAELSANAGWVLLIPIFALFVLKDKAGLSEGALSLVPDQFRGFFRAVIRDLDRMLAQYIRAQLLFVLADSSRTRRFSASSDSHMRSALG
jgi:predicted PurR-regulated permease PerM